MTHAIGIERATGRCWPLGGYAPGSYTCHCVSCGKLHEADKRATQCLVCAVSDAQARATTLERQLATAREALDMAEKRIVEFGWQVDRGEAQGGRREFERRVWAAFADLRHALTPGVSDAE